MERLNRMDEASLHLSILVPQQEHPTSLQNTLLAGHVQGVGVATALVVSSAATAVRLTTIASPKLLSTLLLT